MSPTAVVTGAGGAIGAAITSRLTGRGYRIVAVDVSEVGLNALGDGVITRICDLTDPEAIAALADVVTECDLLVHTAGVVVTTPFERAEAAEFDHEIAVNLLAAVRLTRALFPALQRSGGQVVAVVSLASMLPIAESPGYTASKFGLRGFLLSLGARAPATGVRVSIVNPGAVDTPMLRHEAATGGSALNFLGTPLEPAAVADAVVGCIGSKRMEVNLPHSDGWMIKAAMLVPGLAVRLLPRIARLGRDNLDRYRRHHHIE